MDMKTKILNEMLAKGHIDEEKYRQWLDDENFSDNDALYYSDLAEAYAKADEEGGLTFEELKVKMKQWLAI